jgi:CheY-like chemotaxis protein
MSRGEVASNRPLVLVVEDHEIGRKSLVRLLDAMGYQVIAANDGESALDAMKRAERIDFVLTDLRLPDLDGREVVYAARQLVPRPRIALITGWDVDESEVEKLGLNWVFLKPLNVQEIVKKFQQARSPCDDGPEVG